jgi:ParB/RepB/Spo0J family partition protein
LLGAETDGEMATQNAAAPASPLKVALIPLAQLRESPLNSRRTFDPEALKELADSIRTKGVLTPLLVRSRNVASADPSLHSFEILAGARRSRAAKLGGLDAVPCVVREVDDVTAVEIITIENLQREDLSELEEAEGYDRMLKLGKYDVGELSKRVGKSTKYIYDRVKLLELAPAARQFLVERKITAGHAILLARLEPAEQLQYAKRAARRDYDGGTLSVRRLAETIQWDRDQKQREADAKVRAAKEAANPKPASSGSAYKRPAAEVAKERKRREELARRARLYAALVAKPYRPKPAAAEAEARATIEWMAERLDHDHAKRVCDALGWPPVKTSYGGKDYGKAIVHRLRAMKLAEAERWRLWLVIAAEELYFGTWETPKSGLLQACVKRAGVVLPKGVEVRRGKVQTAAPPKVTRTPKRKRAVKRGKAVRHGK